MMDAFHILPEIDSRHVSNMTQLTGTFHGGFFLL